jgi:hypothetical protein
VPIQGLNRGDTIASVKSALEKLINIYHEILLNEIAVMRSNTIVEEGRDIGGAIIYYNTAYPLQSVEPNASRGLDYLLLAYSVINGIRRIVCGYNVMKPIDPKPECRIENIRNEVVELLQLISDLSKEDVNKIYSSSLESLVAKLVITMIKHGLLYVVPLWAHDNLNIVAARKLYKLERRAFIGDAKNLQDLYSFTLMVKLEKFFSEYGIDIDTLLNEFEKEISEELGLGKDGTSVLGGIDKMLFKTFHGMLYRYASTASALPFTPATLESNVLPFMIEPPLPKSYLTYTQEMRRMWTLLDQELVEAVNTCINRIAQEYNITEGNKIGEVFDVIKDILSEVQKKYPSLSYHQYTYLVKMFRACSDGHSVLAAITSPTGSGKTLIFLLYTLIKVLASKLLGLKSKAVVVYPRKALARDQLERIIELSDAVNKVLKQRGVGVELVIGIRDGDSLNIEREKPSNFYSLREIVVEREGKQYKLCHGISASRDYTVFLAEDSCWSSPVEELMWLRDVKVSRNEWRYLAQYDIVVTNHSILHRLANAALIAKELNEFSDVVGNINIIVVDEAHVYTKENLEILAAALLKLLYTRAYIHKGSEPATAADFVAGLDFIVSSATLTDQHMISKGESKLFTGNIIGFFKIKTRCSEVSSLPPALRDFLSSILPEPVLSVYQSQGVVIHLDYDCAVLKDLGIEPERGSIIWRYPYRIRTALVVIPYPHRNSWTTLLEVLIALMHWINSARLRLENLYSGFSKLLALVFVDSRTTLEDLYRLIIRRYILEEQEQVDRVLLTKLYHYNLYTYLKENKLAERIQATLQIIGFISELAQQGAVSAYQLIYGLTDKARAVGDFNVVPLYLTLSDIAMLSRVTVKSYDDFFNALQSATYMRNVISFIENVNRFAKEAIDKDYAKLLDELKQGSLNVSVLVHHGELKREERTVVESLMKGKLQPIPHIVMATSTLELGVDIEHIPVVVQYATEPLPVELVQRLGRSGRALESFYVSTLLLVLRNTGEDLTYLRDQEAVEYVYNFEVPRAASPYRHADVMLRYITKLYIDSCLSNRDKEFYAEQRLLNFIKTIKSLGFISDARDVEELFNQWLSKVKHFYLRLVESSLPTRPLDKVLVSVCEDLTKILKMFESERIALGAMRSEGLRDSSASNFEAAINAITREISVATNALCSSELQRYGNPQNALPYLRALSRALSATIDLLKQGKPHLEQAVSALAGVMLGVYEYVHKLYAQYLQSVESMRTEGVQSVEVEDKIREYVEKDLHVFDTLIPGIVDDIGNTYINHILIKLKQGKASLELPDTTYETFQRARPLHIKLSE